MNNGHHQGNDNSTKIMAPIWDQFSPIEGRVNHHNFILEVLESLGVNYSNISVLDTCLGTGIDIMPLVKKGYKVYGNEVDLNFRNATIAKFLEQKINIDVFELDWLELKELNQKFDAALCLGNSFCWLFGTQNQILALENFKNILNENGLLLIDERNIQYMMDNRDEILKNSKKTIANHVGLNGKTLYGGKEYFPFPVRITDDEVEMGKFKVGETEPFTSTFFYPFKKGELKSLLNTTFGTQNVTTYSDYKPGFKPDAGFYQYVCKKSG